METLQRLPLDLVGREPSGWPSNCRPILCNDTWEVSSGEAALGNKWVIYLAKSGEHCKREKFFEKVEAESDDYDDDGAN